MYIRNNEFREIDTKAFGSQAQSAEKFRELILQFMFTLRYLPPCVLQFGVKSDTIPLVQRQQKLAHTQLEPVAIQHRRVKRGQVCCCSARECLIIRVYYTEGAHSGNVGAVCDDINIIRVAVVVVAFVAAQERIQVIPLPGNQEK